MRNKLVFLVFLISLAGLVNGALAIDWIGGGPDNSFCTPENWAGGQVPGPDDEVWIDCRPEPCDITVDCDLEVREIHGPAIEGENCNQTMDVVSGNVVCESWEGMMEGDNKVGTLNITGGTVTVTGEGTSFAFTEDGDDNTYAYVNIGGDAIVNVAAGRFRCADNGGNAYVDVSGDAVLSVQDYARIADDGAGYWKFRGNSQASFFGKYEDADTGLQCGCRDNSVDLYVQDNAELYVEWTLNANKYVDSVHHTYISGGVANCDWFLMRSNGNLDVTGGMLICRRLLTLESGAVGSVEPGGTIMAGELAGGGVLDITGTGPSDSGILILDGYKLPEVWDDYVPNGKLTGNGSAAGIEADYDATNPGKTTVWAEVANPKAACCPFPYNTSVEVAAGSDIVLSWVAGEGLGLGRHHVFFGQDRDCVANADCGAAGGGEACWKAQLRASTTQWNSGMHPLWQTSYWRIDEAGVECVKGKVWSFTTGCALIPGDTNLDCVLNFDDYADVASTYGGEQFWPE